MRSDVVSVTLAQTNGQIVSMETAEIRGMGGTLDKAAQEGS